MGRTGKVGIEPKKSRLGWKAACEIRLSFNGFVDAEASMKG